MYELPYYDAIRFAGIDVMHNLFLGTAKSIFSIWKERQILNKAQFDLIQAKINKINVPIDVGRIPYKIESGMSGLTADQWKIWTCQYSLYALSGSLPEEHLDCWWLFVQACIIICRPLLTKTSIKEADKFLHEFCIAVERLYGSEACTINLHLHCHLAEHLLDYGPAHATWCFSFERFNGILGGVPTNNRCLNIEKTMLNRFVQQTESQKSHPHLLEELDPFFSQKKVGSVGDTLVDSDTYLQHLNYVTTYSLQELFGTIESESFVSVIGKVAQHALESPEVACLEEMYKRVLGSAVNVSRICYRFGRATLGSKLLSSQLAKRDQSSYVAANWLSCSSPAVCRPGRVRFFLKHSVTFKNEKDEPVSYETLLAFIDWYKIHPEKNYYLPPTTIWYPEFEPLSAASFMPIKRIACRCMQTIDHVNFVDRPYNNGEVVVIIPISVFETEF